MHARITKLCLQGKKSVPQLLANFDRVQKEGAAGRLEQTVQDTMQVLAGRMRPCCSRPDVDAWEATFKEVQLRYTFLVLDGPSKMGKTLFCRSRSLGSGGSLLEIDCAGADTPDLTHFEFGKHTMVCARRDSAEVVLHYKKFFFRRARPTQASHQVGRIAMHMTYGCME